MLNAAKKNTINWSFLVFYSNEKMFSFSDKSELRIFENTDQ